jgi:hypothetical protein
VIISLRALHHACPTPLWTETIEVATMLFELWAQYRNSLPGSFLDGVRY